MKLLDILKEEQPHQKDMVNGIIEMLRQVEDIENRKTMALDRLSDFKKEGIVVDPKEFLERCGLNLVSENWSDAYKRSIDCDNPKGFSQKAHCQGKEKKESVNENTISDLETRLKSHDWWYAYSDDSRRYNRGESNWSEITKMIKGMKGDKEAEKLWNKYAPKDFNYSFKKLSETQLDEGMFKIGIKHIIPLIPTGYAPNDPKYKADLKLLRTMLNSFYKERGYDKVILPTF